MALYEVRVWAVDPVSTLVYVEAEDEEAAQVVALKEVAEEGAAAFDWENESPTDISEASTSDVEEVR